MTTTGDKTIIGFLGDESGSMRHLAAAVVDGYNQFVGNIRKDAKGKDVQIVLGFFDDSGHDPNKLRIKINGDLASSRELSIEDFSPRGGTPLRDATAEMIGVMDHEREGDEKMMLVIYTDGRENASTEVTAQQLQDLIREKEAQDWEFIYLGANQDAWAAGQSIGVTRAQSFNTTSEPASYAATMDSVSALATSRSTKSTSDYRKDVEELHATTKGKLGDS